MTPSDLRKKKFNHAPQYDLTPWRLTLIYGKKLKDFDWDMSPEEFICVEPVGLIIGGIARNYSYLDEVEILSKLFLTVTK